MVPASRGGREWSLPLLIWLQDGRIMLHSVVNESNSGYSRLSLASTNYGPGHSRHAKRAYFQV